MHSFSFLPVRYQEQWYLLSELALARFLSASQTVRKARLGLTIEEAVERKPRLELVLVAPDRLLKAETPIEEVLHGAKVADGPTLWLVAEDFHQDHLAGVLSPFELM